jgi:predicted O-linked N-acetylglucosamine transferase (SPINDLY family)
VSAEQEAVREIASLYQESRFAELEAAALRWLDQLPRAGFVWKALGIACGALGKKDEAVQAKQRAVELLPRDAEAHANLANALVDVHRLADAERHFRRALALDPQALNALKGLAALLARAGRHAEAAQLRGRICALAPGHAPAFNDWGNALRDAHDMAAAEAAYERALALDPGQAEPLSNLANTLADLGRPRDAERRYREALAAQPWRSEIHSNFGNLLKTQGRHAEALEAYREAMRLDPDFAGGQSNYMLALNHVASIAPQFAKREAMAFGRWASAHVHAAVTPAAASPEGTVRVGFVSGDFRRHPVGYFLESTLKHWPRERVPLTAYATVPAADELTARLKPGFERWRVVSSLSDEGFARQVAADGIDVLVDLAGHTAYNRLPVFAWRPARVQATWLGYFATTGIEQMDWLVSDEAGIRPGEEANFTERIWRLPSTRLCFTPPEERVAVGESPARRNGFPTFGSFQNLGKIDDAVLLLWSRVLREIPGARLRVQNVQLAEEEMRAIFRGRLAAAGIDPARVALHGRMPRAAYLRAHGEVDVVLDTFPYPGGTTTCEALWMGVPTVTLAGDTLLARQGESLLTAAGVPEWIARTPDEYIAKAVALASDTARLAAIRARLRERVARSALFDAPRFARELADAFVRMAAQAR